MDIEHENEDFDEEEDEMLMGDDVLGLEINDDER